MSLKDILDEHGIEYRTEGHHHCRTGWMQIATCPFCRDEDKYHLGYNLHLRYFHCWKCGAHQTFAVLEALTNIPGRELYAKLSDGEERISRKRVERETGRLRPPKGVGDLKYPHIQYLKSRKFDIDYLVRMWEIQGIGMLSTHPWSLYIPFVHRGKHISWTTRKINDKGARYITAKPSEESHNHKHYVYGEDYCTNSIIVHEGPTDVWRTGPGAVATLGVAYLMQQVERIAKYPKRIICYDSEVEAQKRARQLFELLDVFPGETYNVQLDAKDPGSASKKETRQLRAML